MKVVVHAPPQGLPNTLQSTPHPLRGGLASEPEPPAPGLPAVVREAQEVERLRATQPPRPTVRLGVPSELDEPGLVRVQGQIEPAEPFPERVQEAFRVPLVLEPDDRIIGVAHDDGVAFRPFGPPLAMEPEIEDVVQVQEIEDASDIPAAKAAFEAAAAKIGAVTPLNVPEWQSAETTINGHEVTVQADHPVGATIAGRMTLTYWTAGDGDGNPLQIAAAVTRPGGASQVQWQAKIPAGTSYPVSLQFGARNLCGPSTHQVEIDDPSV